MTRQSLIRVLLSLLLLISQQMATAHAMTHWGSVRAGATPHLSAANPGGGEDDLSAAFAQDQTCHQCLAFAQLSGPLGSTPCAFALAEQAQVAQAERGARMALPRNFTPFQPRGPPRA